VEYADVESARLEVEERIAAEQRKQAASQPEATPAKLKVVADDNEASEPAAEGVEIDKNMDAESSDDMVDESDSADSGVVDKQVTSVASQDQTPEPEEETVPSGTADNSSAAAEEA
jgi:hypothetical protein